MRKATAVIEKIYSFIKKHSFMIVFVTLFIAFPPGRNSAVRAWGEEWATAFSLGSKPFFFYFYLVAMGAILLFAILAFAVSIRQGISAVMATLAIIFASFLFKDEFLAGRAAYVVTSGQALEGQLSPIEVFVSTNCAASEELSSCRSKIMKSEFSGKFLFGGI